ncbi:MAG: hypothetical protein PHY45_03930 [Rhodocyclaceae bacterium]|nr:hypothetical protein [Rhodocyclaceae bacterium]
MSEATKSKACLAIIVLLLAVIAAGAYKFIIAGSVEKAEDGRLAVVLAPGERALILKEMRGFVSGIQQITDALARDDMKGVAAAARQLGRGAAKDVPAALIGKLPLEFKTLGFSVHGQFDQIADDAEKTRMARVTLGQLADVLQKCVACHSAYQFRAAP